MKPLGLVLITATSLISGCGRVDRAEFAPAIRQLTLTTPAWVPRTEMGQHLWSSEQRFYRERGNLPAWIDGDRPTAQLDTLLQALGGAETHGFDPARYGLAQLRSARFHAEHGRAQRTSFEDGQVPDLDLRATYAFLMYAADLLGWTLSPREVDSQWVGAPVRADLVTALRTAIERNRVGETLNELAPGHPQYRGLQAALARTRVAAAGGDPHAGQRLEQILMNMQRWRWMPRNLGQRYILVNVPAYELQVVEQGQPALAMRVIVGQPDWPTPLFSDEMTYVVFSPSWNIPETILREETLPRIARDPDYIDRNHIEVVRTSGQREELLDPASIDWENEEATRGLRFRQAPGPDNALGLVKFIFPNHFNVYLHDTPNDALFNLPQRALSHGCIRVENPVGLADYVLRDRPGWTQERIEAAMQKREEQSVTLKEHIAVHIAYFTAWVQPDGSIEFLADPYGLDKKQAIVRAQ